jgi:hypothetical protein
LRKTARPPARGSRRGAFLQPWLLVVPALAVGGGVLLLYGPLRGAPPAAMPSASASAPATVSAAASAPIVAAPPMTSAAAPVASPPAPVAAPTPRPRPTPPPATPSPRVLAPTPAPVVAATVAPTPAPTSAAPVTPAAPALLQVVVRPWGEVTVDGRLVGQTPLDRIPLGAGVHRLRIRHPSYEVWEREVTLRAGQVEKVIVDFPASGVKKP